ncbi:unnamed protein product [Allacma fusca]|uniref:Uncharacterized protein n=1 Tax=Allacma fusca TaxID=39272 RepID=A0A8J2P582_9HEXA|nr:unnamed protein product [Allacma fusca]
MAAISAGFGFGGLEIVVNFVLQFMLQLREGTDIWRVWTTIPIPLYMKFRLFNITNPEEFAEGAKAKLVEMGPYVYQEDPEKVNITINLEEDWINYTQPRTYYFRPEMSNGLESDEVTFINIIFLAVASLSHEFTDDDFMLGMLDGMLTDKGEKLYRTATVRELLFDGVSIKTYIDLFTSDAIKAAAEAANQTLDIPENIADGKFALLKGKNGTGDGYFVVRSGRNGNHEIGKILTWNDKSTLSYWRGTPEDGCNQINGTDSTIFPPFMTKETKVEAFSSQICRSLTFEFDKESEAERISTYRFHVSPTTFMSPNSYPPNWCFCPKVKNETNSCIREGVLDIRACFGGAPMIASLPHFLGAEDWIPNAVEGLSPDPEKHKMIIDFHPRSGSPIKAYARVQFSIELIPYPAMASFESAQRALIPLAWVEEDATLDDMNLMMLRLLDNFVYGFQFAKFALIGLGVALVVLGLVIAVTGKKSSSAKVKSVPEEKVFPAFE